VSVSSVSRPGSVPGTPSASVERRLTVRVWWGLALAWARYETTVASLVRTELGRWEARAREIPGADARRLALEKLRGEAFNARAAAMLATQAPRARRRDVVEAIVALEVLYDYLDGLTEGAEQTPQRRQDSVQLFQALTDAVSPTSAPAGDYFSAQPARDDSGYLAALTEAVRRALGRLPALSAVQQSLHAAAARGADAQMRAHDVTDGASARLQEWAESQSAESGLGWREFIAGAAASVLCAHVLIAAASRADTTPARAAALDAAYLPTSALVTLLDGVVDHESDGELASYASIYDDHEELAVAISTLARSSIEQTGVLADRARHATILAGAVAFYLSAPGARSEFAAPVTQRLRRELGGLLTLALAGMRAWRAVARMTGRRG
jgi:tetraprenyl-beta-curcumene synthase